MLLSYEIITFIILLLSISNVNVYGTQLDILKQAQFLPYTLKVWYFPPIAFLIKNAFLFHTLAKIVLPFLSKTI